MNDLSPPSRLAFGYTLEGASFAVPGRMLVHPLDLEIAPGRVVGLVGHNGSGKSTLLKLLARQERPTAGRIRFGTRELATWGERDFARHVAYLPQTTPPAPGLTVRDLAALGRYPWHGPFGRFTAADRARVEAALEATGTRPLAERAVDALSGGERQRAWLAMLVAQDAGCLLLDEPISALDVAHQIEVLGLVRSLSRSHGVGVVVVLHDINMAARFCDEIVALKAGHLVARGRPHEIVTAPMLEAIYGLRMAILPHPDRTDPVAVPL